MATPNPVYLFRMVHWQNIQYILEKGLCCRDHVDRDPNYISIGHRQLITDRHEHPIPLDGYGNLGEYIPFYFWGRTPMLYLIMNGYKGVRQYPQEDIVFIVVDSARIFESGLQYVFTDRNARTKLANFIVDPGNLKILRWDVIRSDEWKNTEDDFQRMDFKQAEFLVRHHVPMSFIDRLIVKNENRRVEVENIVRNLGLSVPVIKARKGKLYY